MNNMNNINNNNMNNMNYNMNNNINNNMNISNKNDPNLAGNNDLKQPTIFVTFTIEKYNKQVYMDINNNETFVNLKAQLEEKYIWLQSIPNKKYLFNGKDITNENSTIKKLGLIDNSDIIIKT